MASIDEIDTARRWLSRRCDGLTCEICGVKDGEDHEPTDICGIVAGLLRVLGRYEPRASDTRRISEG